MSICMYAMMILMIIMMTEPYAYDDDTDDDNDHKTKNGSCTAAGAALGPRTQVLEPPFPGP